MRTIFILLIIAVPLAFAADMEATLYIVNQSKLNPAGSNALHSYSFVYSMECNKEPKLADIKAFHRSAAYDAVVKSSATTPLGLSSVQDVLKQVGFKIDCGEGK